MFHLNKINNIYSINIELYLMFFLLLEKNLFEEILN